MLNLVDLSPLPGAMQMVEDAGRSLGLATHAAYANSPAEIESAFMAARRLRVAGVNVLNSPFLHAERARIIQLAASAKLPAIYQWPESVEDGRSHQRAVLAERVGRIPATAATWLSV